VDVTLRDGTSDDAQAIAQIYSHYVLTSCSTFEEEPPAPGEIRTRMAELLRGGFPWIVAELSDGTVAGYAYAGPFKPRSAYRFTVENSVYIHPERVRRGLGTMLMRRLIAECEARGFRQMVAVIGDSANDASRRLHARLGFADAGMLPAAGFKFGRWVDVVLMQLPLGDGAATSPIQSGSA
jgi:phosphinothricin acetyltransferase